MTTAKKPEHKKRRPPLHSADRKLREKVALAHASPEGTPDEAHIKNLHKLVEWIKSGQLPAGEMRRGEMHAVENKAG